MVGIEGSTAIITGGTRGIGLAAARGLGALGATVVLIGQDASRAAAAAASLQEQGIDAIGAGCDVTDYDSLAALASELGPLGEADILIASAGVMSERMSKTLRTTAAEWQRVMSINVDGVFNAMSVFGPGMVERRVGRIIAAYSKDNPAAAFGQMGPLVRDNPSDPSPRLHLALMLLWLRDPETARAEFRQVATLAPDTRLGRTAQQFLDAL